jgi:hypothetical protein
MTSLFGRNLDHQRPYLGPGLVRRPAREEWRLQSLARLIVPYHSDAVIDEGVAVTREILQATVDLARSRGAAPLIVVLQIGHEAEPEARLRRRIFDSTALPSVFVEIDPAWHLPWDRHPDARAAQVIATAIVDRLRPH